MKAKWILTAGICIISVMPFVTLAEQTIPPVENVFRMSLAGTVAAETASATADSTKDEVRVRMAVIDEDIWPQPSVQKKLPPDASKRVGFTDYINDGRVWN